MNLSRIGPFAIEERLGPDRDSTVYRAVHIQQRRSVAVKVFSAPLVANNPQAKQALVREIEKLKALVHPHIARCYGGILESSQGCIACELVEGESLTELLARRGRLAWETVADYGLQIASALDYAHTAGVLHQDLNPDKILVGEHEKVKLIDFRLDRASNPTCVSSHKQTPRRALYWAPEQLRGDSQVTHKADLYALGCLLFEMLVGYPPFQGATVAEIRQQQLETAPPRVDSIVLDCPVWLESLIGQLLEKDPARRPHGAAAVILALEETQKRVAAGTGVLEHAAGGFSSLQRKVDKELARDLLSKARREQRDKNRVEEQPFYEQAWFLGACLLALIGVVVTWLAWPVNEEKLFQRAKAAFEKYEALGKENSRADFQQILENFPDGEYADEARGYLDQLDMASAERRLLMRTKLGQEPKSEGERLFADAWKFESFGDRLTALDQYYSLINLLADSEEDRPFINLARRQIATIERDTSPEDRIEFVEQRLADAERLAEAGRLVDARKIWNGIATLYGSNREFSVQVQRAQSWLDSRTTDDPAK